MKVLDAGESADLSKALDDKEIIVPSRLSQPRRTVSAVEASRFRRWTDEDFRLQPGTIKMARQGRTLPQPQNQRRLLRAIITYFSDHPLPMFETIREHDPAGIAREVRARASAVTGSPKPSEAALATARTELSAKYEESIAVAIGFLSL
jgi:hypothetical protein